MNDRIRELWDKAAQATAAYPSGQNTSWETQVNFMDKFAELIVREVLGQVDEFSRLTKAYQKQGIDPEIDVTKEVLKNLGFPRFPRS